MKYNPLIHNRQSIRMQGYDYGREGLYFVTFNCQDRIHLFGKITAKKMFLNEAGTIAQHCWLEIPKHFPHVKLHEFVIMPDHIHGILEITENVGILESISTIDGIGFMNQNSGKFSPNFKSPIKTVGSVIRGFKIGVTKWMRQNTDVQKVWQRGYYDRIIQDEAEFHRISKYIFENPEKWEEKMRIKENVSQPN